jgi:hypothetical protein
MSIFISQPVFCAWSGHVRPAAVGVLCSQFVGHDDITGRGGIGAIYPPLNDARFKAPPPSSPMSASAQNTLGKQSARRHPLVSGPTFSHVLAKNTGVLLKNSRVEVPPYHCFPPKQSCGGITMPLFSSKTVVWRYHHATVLPQNTRVEVPLCHCFTPKQSCFRGPFLSAQAKFNN